MKIARRVVLAAAIALAAFGQASAQDWPSRSVTVVVPIPAGVASDIIARAVFEQVGKQVGQTFVTIDAEVEVPGPDTQESDGEEVVEEDSELELQEKE